MLDEDNAHIGVYQVLDQVMVATSVPPGIKGAIYSIIDHLRLKSAPVEDLGGAEQISVGIHKLESALRCADETAILTARDELKSLAAAWIQRRIFTGSPVMAE